MSSMTLRIPVGLMAELRDHLFPGDGDEHGAVIGVGVSRTARGTRLLARRLYLARDGIEYVPGERGYRMLTPTFVRDRVLECDREGLGYLAVHCHGGTDEAGFSPDDNNSHERGYPAIRDILDGRPVGALVFATNAVAGDIWLPDGVRVELDSALVIGQPLVRLYSQPPTPPPKHPGYDRQTRIFGDRGQAILKTQKIGVIGAGGIGSLVVEYLARLGVGEIVLIDPDRVEATNLPRIAGSRRRGAHIWLTDSKRSTWIQKLGHRFSTSKVKVGRRVARVANPDIQMTCIPDDVTKDAVAKHLIDCDYLFLAADSMQARLVFNALVHQYLIPGVQLGARVLAKEGVIDRIYSVVRPVLPDFGCLLCNGLIDTNKLQEEALSPEERKRQRYVDDDDIEAPSVISLNAVAAAHGVDHYLYMCTGLFDAKSDLRWTYYFPVESVALERVEQNIPGAVPDCIDCGSASYSRLGMGDAKRLPTRQQGIEARNERENLHNDSISKN